MAGRLAGSLSAAALLACITSYDVLPLCEAGLEVDPPDADCRRSEEARKYEDALAREILRRSQWQFPVGVPLRVSLDAQGRVGRVCVGSAAREASWSTRDRVAASLRSLHALPPGPACLAGTTLALASDLAGRSVDLTRFPMRMSSCEELRDTTCANRMQPVCGIYDDGRRRTFPDPCRACRDWRVAGFLEFECRREAERIRRPTRDPESGFEP